MTRPALAPAPVWRTALRRAAPWLIGLALAMCWDRAVYLHLRAGAHAPTPEDAALALEALQRKGWYRFLWILGRVEPWLFVAAAILFVDFGGNRRNALRALRRAVFLPLSVAISGAAAELLKLVFRRLRPNQNDGWYAFRSFSDNFLSAENLGLPSGHATTSFAAAFALCWMWPRAAPVFLAAAIGCSVSRLLAGAHFLSDVLVGAALAFFIVLGLYALDRRNNRGQGIDALGTATPDPATAT